MVNYKKKYLKYKFKFEKLISKQKAGMYDTENVLTEEQHGKLFRGDYDNISKKSLGLCSNLNCERSINRNDVCCNGCFNENHSDQCDQRHYSSSNNKEQLLQINNILEDADKFTSFSYRDSISRSNSPTNSTSVSLARTYSDIDQYDEHVDSFVLDSKILFETDPEDWKPRHSMDCMAGSALWTGFIDEKLAEIYAKKSEGRGLFDQEAIKMLKEGELVHESIMFTKYSKATPENIIQKIEKFKNGTYTIMFLSPTEDLTKADETFKHIVIIGKTKQGQYILVDRQENQISSANKSCLKYVYIGDIQIQKYLDAYRIITGGSGVSFKLIIYDKFTRDFSNMEL